MDTHNTMPYITAYLPGIGGKIKTKPSHFVVREIPLYEPSGDGEHVYVSLTRSGWTTQSLRKELAGLFDIKEVNVGYAGMKDKQACVTQIFSLHLHKATEPDVMAKIEDSLPVKINWAKRHQNKLRVGHLIGNRFEIVVADPVAGAQELSENISSVLSKHGVPNFYGVQRFGIHGDNARRGRDVLLGNGRCKHWLRNLLISAFTSALFNQWLICRIERGWFDTLLVGDMAKKADTGGLFEVTDLQQDMERFRQQQIGYTGPIYGSKMRWALAEAGELEKTVLDQSGVTIDMFRKHKAQGSRRTAQVFLNDLSIQPHPDGLQFMFTLPKGAYATTVMREFMKTEPALPSNN